MNEKNILALIICFLMLFIVSCKEQNNGGVADDWQYKPKKEIDFGWFSSKSANSAVSESADLGFSVGGAKDAENFRENIKNGYFPLSTDITYNGLFYDYYFDTKNDAVQKSDELFSPSFSTAVSKDPLSGKDEYYMTVGLNSNIKESDFERKKLNLIIVLDISGSMSSGFNEYYYDGKDNDDKGKTKMQIANESVNLLIDRLKDDDNFGMVLFDDEAYLAKPLNSVAKMDKEAIKNHVLEIQPMGGTNFEAGYSEANSLMEKAEGADANEYENRIIVITDAMPNTGRTGRDDLLSMVENNAKSGVYTTFIGVGVDFNTELIETISDVKGANYYSVHSAQEFKSRMDEQFEYMVTPLVFDLELKLDSKDFEIVKVYGSDTANEQSGSLMRVNTLFPSKTSDNGEVKGGVVLLKLKKLDGGNEGKLSLKVSYKDRTGKDFSNEQSVNFNAGGERYDNTGVRKAIVLSRYANVVKSWILAERSDDVKVRIIPTDGIGDYDYTEDEIIVILGEHERPSQKLSVSDDYKQIFKQIQGYIEAENKELKDETFNKEIEILKLLQK